MPCRVARRRATGLARTPAGVAGSGAKLDGAGGRAAGLPGGDGTPLPRAAGGARGGAGSGSHWRGLARGQDVANQRLDWQAGSDLNDSVQNPSLRCLDLVSRLFGRNLDDLLPGFDTVPG